MPWNTTLFDSTGKIKDASAGPKGLDFPGNAGVTTTIRATIDDPEDQTPALEKSPATFIWKCYPRKQTGTPTAQGYFTNFFFAENNSNFGNSTANGYYGLHPYPRSGEPGWPSISDPHDWEISTESSDILDGANGEINDGDGDYDKWYTQAFTISGTDGQNKSMIYYFDFETDTARTITRTATPSQYQTFLYGVDSALCFFDAPWNEGNECWSGILRGYQIYHGIAMTVQQITDSLADPEAVQTPWYLNINPTPTDITDKSGNGNDMVWVNSERPSLWSG